MFTKKDINLSQQNVFYPATFIYPFQVQVTLQAQSFYIKGKHTAYPTKPVRFVNAAMNGDSVSQVLIYLVCQRGIDCFTSFYDNIFKIILNISSIHPNPFYPGKEL